MAEDSPLIDTSRLREVNYSLAKLYQHRLHERDARATAEKERLRREAPVDVRLVVGNTVDAVNEDGDGTQVVTWTVYARPANSAHSALLRRVRFDLHPTFPQPSVTVSEAPFRLTRRGWGTFNIKIAVEDVRGAVHRTSHDLTFDTSEPNEHSVTIRVAPAVRAPSPPAGPAVAAVTATDEAKTAGSDAVPGVGGAGRGAGAGTAAAATAVRRMTGVDRVGMHGHNGKADWAAPILVTYCDTEARPGYNSMKAHEYTEDPATLAAKIKELARLIRASRHCVAYTGAGISTASGIDDYASKSKASVATGTRAVRPKRTGLSAEPTFAHYVLTALHRADHLKQWVQCNHDGLPQKAGFPQRELNEIHGAWFDPSNPVVPMTGTLRTDLCEWMEEQEQEADLVLALGTSLCGMNADRMVDTPGRKAIRGVGLGAVIVGLQRTAMDDLASLHIYAKLDEVMLLLAMEMGLRVPLIPYKPNVPRSALVTGKRHTFMVPYDKHGRLVAGGKLRPWRLEVGSRVRVTAGPGKGYVGSVVAVNTASTNGGYTVKLPCQREGSPDQGKVIVHYALGSWFVEAAARGELKMLPIVNA